MQAMKKEHYLLSQMMMMSQFVENTKSNLDDTIFEDDDGLYSLIEAIDMHLEIAVGCMKKMMKENDSEDC